MRIAIDINDVIRDYSDNFLKEYITNYNHEYDINNFELWSNNMQEVLPFKTDRAYSKFVYEDYSWELFAKCDTCDRKLPVVLKDFINSLKNNYEDVEILFVSPNEIGASIGCTYFFISKLSCDVREVYLPLDSNKIWDKCDILITANPLLLDSVPENKKVIKIKKEYNENITCDYSYESLMEFIKNNEINKFLE